MGEEEQESKKPVEKKLVEAKPWKFHLQVASYRLLPVTVKPEGVMGNAGWFGEQERKDTAMILKKYLRYRIERVWAKEKKSSWEVVSGKRGVGKKTMAMKAAFKPIPSAHNILQPSLGNLVSSEFRLFRYSTTPNELVVDVTLEP